MCHSNTIRSLELEPLLAALRALQSAADRRTVQKLRALLEETEGAPLTSSPPGRAHRQVQSLRYDPSSVFLLEMMLSIAIQAKRYLEDVW
jgi:brefeldin A-resistance guanine nucleotide exchange factor 1